MIRPFKYLTMKKICTFKFPIFASFKTIENYYGFLLKCLKWGHFPTILHCNLEMIFLILFVIIDKYIKTFLQVRNGLSVFFKKCIDKC